MPPTFSDQQLAAYLNESLASELMVQVEAQLRVDEELRERLAEMVGKRALGIHGLGEIWQRMRLSCPSREELEKYLRRALSEDQASYIQFHLSHASCRWCRSNLEDLEEQISAKSEERLARRHRIFQSSSKMLRND